MKPLASDDRSTYIGGPGAATILGVNTYQTPLALWLQLTGRSEPIEVNDAMRSGMRLEPAVLAYAGEALQTEIIPGPFVRDMREPLGGHLDGLTIGGDVVEAKTSRIRSAWGEPGTGDVPPAYAAQCMHYLGLMPRARVAHLAVLFSGLDFAMYRIERDDQLIGQMREICAKWWRDYVVSDTPPPPVSGADALALFPKDTGRVVIASDAVADAVKQLRSVREMEKALEEEREALESRIKLELGDGASLMVGGEVACTWRTTKPIHKFDTSKFKSAEPDLYQMYCNEITQRRFLLKG